MKTKESILHSISAKQNTVKTFLNNPSEILETETEKKNGRSNANNKSNTSNKKDNADNSSSLNFTTLNKLPLTYSHNCSKELLILNTLSKNNCLSPNNYLINQKTVLSIVNTANRQSCFLCKAISPKLINTLSCSHLFCDICIRLLINNNFLIKENSFKCPIIPCMSYFNQEVLKVAVLSKNTLSDKTRTIDTSNNNNQSQKNNEPNIRIYNQTANVASKGVQSTQFHTNSFLFFMKNKGRSCRNCSSEKLFSPIDKLTFFCLNCSKRVCQKCYRYCDETHFDVKYVNHCPILDSQHKKDKGKASIPDKINIYFFELFGLVIGCLILLTGHAMNIKHVLFYFRRKKLKGTLLTCVLNSLCYPIVFLLVFLEICLFVITLPYYSAVLLVLDCINEKCSIN